MNGYILFRKADLKKLITLLFGLLFSMIAGAESIHISTEEALEIGVKIWYNECSGSANGLTSWSDGENFASLGIGHFLWYPYGRPRVYSESFPELLKFMEQHGAIVPRWLQGNWTPYCPWNNREEFLAAQNNWRMIELRRFLLSTIPLQAEFMVDRMESSLPRMIMSVSPEERPYVQMQLYRIAQTPLGIYALVDYVNFKGAGVTPQGTYDAQGWGLLTVIEHMKYAPPYLSPLQQFVWSADRVLTQRVMREPLYRHDWLWLAGWRNRLRTYLD